MNPRALKVHSSELAAGKRASFHVYYLKNGKLLFDPSWLGTPEEAGAAIVAMVREVYPRAKVELAEVVAVTPAFPEP
jgi:hypothetical protein